MCQHRSLSLKFIWMASKIQLHQLFLFFLLDSFFFFCPHLHNIGLPAPSESHCYFWRYPWRRVTCTEPLFFPFSLQQNQQQWPTLQCTQSLIQPHPQTCSVWPYLLLSPVPKALCGSTLYLCFYFCTFSQSRATCGFQMYHPDPSP